MRILAINGSPKGERSNTWQLTQAFLDGVTERLGADNVELRTVIVRDLDIQPCRGCFACWRNEAGQCVIKDDMRDIIADCVWADVTIWSFPLYYFGVPGPLKNLIDRQLPMSLPFMVERTDGVGNGSHPGRYDMSGKRSVIISTCGFYTAEGNYDSVLTQFDHICGKGAYEQKAELSRLLFPRQTFEAMADASWGISKETGTTEDEAISFTRQMAALYNPASFDGTVRVLEMDYTDRGVSCCVVLEKDGATVVTDGSVAPTTSIHTPFVVWQDIAQGKVSGTDALAQHLYRVTGDFDLMIHWGEFFGGPEGEQAKHPASVSALKPPTMLALLIPWIAFWTCMSFGLQVGVAGTIVACAVTTLAFCRHEHTVYDCLSSDVRLPLACWRARPRCSSRGRSSPSGAHSPLVCGLWPHVAGVGASVCASELVLREGQLRR